MPTRKRRKNRRKGGSSTSNQSTTKRRIIQSALLDPVIEDMKKMVELRSICNDSNDCLMFGINREQIIALFDNFAFEYLNKIELINKKSVNGIIYKCDFKNKMYDSLFYSMKNY